MAIVNKQIDKATALKLHQENKYLLASNQVPTARIIADRYENVQKSVFQDDNYQDTSLPEEDIELKHKNLITTEDYQNSSEFVDSTSK